MSKVEINQTAEFLRGKYTAKGKKSVCQFGGNFWGINRNRCMIIKPEVIKALAEAGVIKLSSNSKSFTVVIA